MEFRSVREEDLNGIINIFVEGFQEDILASLGGNPPRSFYNALFRLFIKTEKEAFLVVVDEKDIAGYIFIPANLNKVWVKAIFKGYVFILLAELLKWRGLKFKFLKTLVFDKFLFLTSFKKAYQAKAQVLSIAVAEKFRGIGLAQQLLTRGLAYIKDKKVAKVRLEVRPWNKPAQRVYEKVGFKYLGSSRDTHGDWLVMIYNF